MPVSQGLHKGAMLRHNTYRIEKVLGQGGFGITYLATDLSLERLVAIKEFFPQDYCDRDETTSRVTIGTSSSRDLVERFKVKFLKEARNIAKFDHPGIIKIHAAFEENNTAYYVMDYIDGSSLSSIIKSNGPLSRERAINYITRVGEALEYVHDRNINHLDVKPANIMIRRDNDRPVLIDFGLSKQYDSDGSQTSTTPVGISHGYAPMEQYSDGGIKEFSPQTDLYALAATLYTTLSGVTPPQATLLVEDDLTFPSSIPADLAAPISKAMSTRRKNRHESVADFLREINSAKPAHATTTSVQKRSTEQSDKAPQPVASVSAETTVLIEKKQQSSSSRKFIYIGAAVVAAILVYLLLPRGPKIETQDELSSNKIFSVDSVEWSSPLGRAIYWGAAYDSVTTIPHGRGYMVIIDGEYKDCRYDGNFKDGQMDGEATYTLSNGDTFEGTFGANEFVEGKYTIKSTGEYFIGTFKNKMPGQGTWYTADGTPIK